MTTLQRLGAADLRRAVIGYRDLLRAHQDRINRLNVYPVPDGDTGTNMALTLEAVVSELEGVEPRAGLAEVCKAIGHGSLMGARGNSGVILSQLLRGMSERMGAAGPDGVGVEELVDAMAHASDLARRAVVRPVEGTILTVASAAAEGAAVGGGSSAGGPAGHGEEGHVGDLRYEVMYLLSAPDDSVDAFKEVWAGIGDSIVVVGGDGLWNCHIHTNDIGAAIEAGVDAGRPRRIRVTDLEEQMEEERWVRDAPPEEEVASTEPVATAVVAVATGEGIGRIF